MSKITKQTMDQQNTERVVDQDYPLEHVPKSARKSLLSISCVLIGFTFFTPTMASGASLGAAFKFDELILIITAGSIILGLRLCVVSGLALVSLLYCNLSILSAKRVLNGLILFSAAHKSSGTLLLGNTWVVCSLWL